jgi:glycosyltransferase involved in cell wall biosynthesis
MMCSPVAFKGSKDGIAALEIAKNKFPDLRVVLFGNSRRSSWIPQWMTYARNPPQNWIVEELYNGSSIVLSSSVTEGFALPPAEGAACGCAIVATDSGGIRDFVQNGVTGLLSSPKNPEALANNICLLLGNNDLRIRLARSANDFIKNFTWARSTDLLESFMLQAVDRKPAPRRPASAVEVSPA